MHERRMTGSIDMGSVMKDKRVDFSISYIEEKEVSPKFWEERGKKPFYRISMYEGYLGQIFSGYIEKEVFETFMGRVVNG